MVNYMCLSPMLCNDRAVYNTGKASSANKSLPGQRQKLQSIPASFRLILARLCQLNTLHPSAAAYPTSQAMTTTTNYTE